MASKKSDTLRHSHPASNSSGSTSRGRSVSLETYRRSLGKPAGKSSSSRHATRSTSSGVGVTYTGSKSKSGARDGSGRKTSPRSKVEYNGKQTSGWVTVNGRHIFLG